MELNKNIIIKENKKIEIDLINKLFEENSLKEEEYGQLLLNHDHEVSEYLYQMAQKTSKATYGNKIYTRGLIEFTNYCKNNCYYCGIRKGNHNIERYRLSEKQILDCAAQGYELGFRTFVLQGGEDVYYTEELLGQIVKKIKQLYPDCAITLSVGEKEYDTYQYWHECGADRYLLRHETADEGHYRMLHPDSMSLAHRKQCLWDLKQIGYQVGAGFMVGSPGQTTGMLIKDLAFLKELQPDMIGIGPFISQKDTPFADKENGTLELTLKLLAMIRLMMPKVLLPATTALGTIHPKGRELGILAGANVLMPNLSPTEVREKYLLYDNKICTGDESAQCRNCLNNRMKNIGYELVVDRGDSKMKEEKNHL